MTKAQNPDTLTVDPAAGLEGVVVAHTGLSDVDGQNGRLILRGKSIEDLAGKVRFEEAVLHLWHSYVFSDAEELCRAFGAARQSAWSVVPLLEMASPDLSVYERMQLGLTALPINKTQPSAVSITGALPVFLAAAHRISKGESPVRPDPTIGTAEDLLRMLNKDHPETDHVSALDRYLVTILDHGLNASTFAARVIGSTKADMKQAVLGGMAALSGPLHGGAPGPVLDMIDAIGRPESAEGWIREALLRRERLMGFGHRIYRTRDPRADVLKAGLRQLGAVNPKVKLAEDIEAEALAALKKARPDRALDTNVEFYTAVLLDALGIDRELFTPLFATGRTPGWCAHVMEQQATGKLIRPASQYVGPEAG